MKGAEVGKHFFADKGNRFGWVIAVETAPDPGLDNHFWRTPEQLPGQRIGSCCASNSCDQYFDLMRVYRSFYGRKPFGCGLYLIFRGRGKKIGRASCREGV